MRKVHGLLTREDLKGLPDSTSGSMTWCERFPTKVASYSLASLSWSNPTAPPRPSGPAKKDKLVQLAIHLFQLA